MGLESFPGADRGRRYEFEDQKHKEILRRRALFLEAVSHFWYSISIMKRNIWFLAFGFIAAGFALADAGYMAVHPSTSAAGPLYSAVEHPSVSLASEVLVFDADRDEWIAEFVFSNDGSAEKVLAGFPVRLRLPVLRRGEGWVDLVADETIGATVLKELFGAAAVVEPDEAGRDLVREKFTLSPENELFGSHFIRVSGPVEAKRIERAGAVFAPRGYSLTQDGREAPVTSVIIESAPGNDWLDITLHALHELRFPTGQQSRLKAVYLASSRFKTQGGNRGSTDSHASCYILGTGGTWKGPIGRFSLIVSGGEGMNGVSVKVPAAVGPAGRYSDGLRSYDFFSAESFEPARDTEISLSFETESGQEPQVYLGPPPPLNGKSIAWGKRLDKPKAPAQADLVKVLRASSWLKDTLDLVVAPGWIKAADFGPLALFDGYPSTAWCEGKADDGIGEWVEFSVDSDVAGLSIWNGFSYIPYDSVDEVRAALWALTEEGEESALRYTDEWREAGKGFNAEEDWSAAAAAMAAELEKKLTGNLEVFKRNNRVGQLEISSLETGLKYKIDLADRRGRQLFPACNLTAGSYRLTILSIYKGSKYRDTLLGELFFHPMDRRIQTLMQEDQLFNQVFDALRKRK